MEDCSVAVLIVRENRRYARRQATWFRKEAGVRWLETPGEHQAACEAAAELLAAGLRGATGRVLS